MRIVRRKGAKDVAGALDPDLLPTPDDLERARTMSERFAGAGLLPVRLFEAPRAMSKARRVWIAAESMQVTGSFKVRGALLAIERLRARTKNEPLVILAVSAGNHGVGVAHAAKHLGVEAHVVVPRGAPRTKVDKIKKAGAHVIVASSPGYDDAEKEAIALAVERKATFLSPYDDIDVLTGNGASLGFEILRALAAPSPIVLCPVGGSGLAAGLASAFRHELGAKGARVVPVQSEASCAFAMSLERDEAVVELPPAETLAEGLEGGISKRAFARSVALGIEQAIVVTEHEIEAAMAFAARELGLLIEGSAAVALAPLLDPHFNPAMLGDAEDIVVVLTGRNVDADRVFRVLSSS